MGHSPNDQLDPPHVQSLKSFTLGGPFNFDLSDAALLLREVAAV